MLELTLTELLRRVYYSMPPEIMIDISRMRKNTSASIDSAFELTEEFIFKNHFKDLLLFEEPKEYEEILAQLHSIAVLYCSFYFMEYSYHSSYPSGKRLDNSFIRDFYECDAYESTEIYRYIRRQQKALDSITSFPDPQYLNPFVVKQWNSKQSTAKNPDFAANIYSGQILKYLKKCHVSINNKAYTKDLVPSVTFLALRNAGYLPNGGNANKSKFDLSSNTLQSFDKYISTKNENEQDKKQQGTNAFSSENSITNVIKAKIYYPSNETIANLMNLAVIDDIYRLDRINHALYKIEWQFLHNGAYCWDKITEKAAIKAFSLYTAVPAPLLALLSPYIDSIVRGILIDNLEGQAFCAQISLSFISIIIPYYIAMFCFFMLPDKVIASIVMEKETSAENQKTIIELKELIESLNLYLENHSQEIKTAFTNTLPRIWSDSHCNSSDSDTRLCIRNKGNNRSNHFVEWKGTHHYTFNETLGLILNQTQSGFSNHTLLMENYYRTQTKLFHYSTDGNLIPLERLEKILGSSELLSPFDYIKKLTTLFIAELSK